MRRTVFQNAWLQPDFFFDFNLFSYVYIYDSDGKDLRIVVD